MKKRIVIAAISVAVAAAGAVIYFFVAPLLFAPRITGALGVESFAPQGKGVPVSSDGIAVMFNRAMVPISTLDGGRKRELPISIEPPLPGRFSWLGIRGFIFRPDSPLAPATTYRVGLPAGIVSIDGHRLEQPLSWEFSTVGPRVIKIEPGDGGTLLPRDASIFFQFNIAMNTADVERNLKLIDDATGVELSAPRGYSWGDDEHTLEIRFKGELPWSAKIRVILPAGLGSKAGSIKTASEISLVYETPDKEAKVLKVAAADSNLRGEDESLELKLEPGKESVVSAGSGICYLFSQPVLKKSFERAFRVESPAAAVAQPPQGNGKPRPFYYFADYEEFRRAGRAGSERRMEGYRLGCVSFLDDFNRSYQFSIDPGKIEFVSGARLGEEGELFSVKTRDAEPSLKSLLTKNIISPGGQMAIPYRSINVSDLTLRLYRVADPWSYDEGVKSETFWNLPSEGGDPLLHPIGSSSFKVPVDRATMTISQARMEADIEQKVPVDFRENAWARTLVNLAEFASKPSQGIWLVEAIPTPSVEVVGGRPPRAVYSMIEISSVGLAMKREVDHVLAWATDIESGEPIAGQRVKVNFAKWNSEKGVMEKSHEIEGATDAQGVSVMPAPAGEDLKACAEISSLDRFAWSCGADHNLTGYRDMLRKGKDFFAYVYTDRPIYRPGQQLFFSAFVREVREGRYFMPDPGASVSVVARDSSGAEIYSDPQAKINPGGIVSGEFQISGGDQAPRGAYTLVLGFGEQRFTKSFMVTSYRKPTFKVDLSPASREIISGGELRAELIGSYFFGAPMRRADASWSIMTSTYVFAPEGYDQYSFIDDDLLRRRVGQEGEFEYFSDFEYDILAASGFGGEMYAEDSSQYDDPRYAGATRGGFGSSFFEGEREGDARFVQARLNDDGKLSISYRPQLKKYPASQTLTLEAGVSDPSMQQVSASADVVVHKGDFYLGLKPQRWVWGEKEKAEVDVATLDTSGKPAPNRSFTVDVIRREHKFIEKRNAAGFWDFVFTPQDFKVKTIKAKSDATGRAKIEFSIPQGGEYRFVARGRDGAGNEIQSAVAVYAWGEGYVPWRMDKPEELELLPDKDSYMVGETARVLVKSLMPLTKALVTYERGRLLEYKVGEQGGNATHIEIPIESGMIPNFYLSVVAHVGRDGARPPLLFYGETGINVEPESKKLTVSVEADRKGDKENLPVYRPGDTVTIKVKTKDPDGKPIRAHAIVSVADESVFRLLNYQLPDLVKKFYYRRPSGVATSSSMVSLKAGDSGDAGRKRRVFKDTAHFVSDLSTDDNGEGSFSFVLPDDLTTWVVEALASTEPKSRAEFEKEREAALKATPIGQSALGANLALSDGNFVGGSRAKIMTTLPLVLRLALPRFVAWGDRVSGKVIANNRGFEEVEGEIELAVSGGASLKGGKGSGKLSAQIPAGEEKSYPVEIDIASNGNRFFLSAKAINEVGEELDELEVAVPMKDRFSPEVVATSGMTDGEEIESIDIPDDIEKGMGNLKIRLRAALALAAAPSLKALIDFPFGCSEQKSATLAAYLFTRRMTDALGETFFDSLAPVPESVAKNLADSSAKMKYIDSKIEGLLEEIVRRFLNYDGGLRYWPGSPASSYFATVQAFWAMTMAKVEGFSVDEGAMTRMRTYIRGRVAPPARDLPLADQLGWDEKAYGLWALSLGNLLEAGVGDEIASHAEEMSISGLSYLAMALEKQNKTAAGDIIGRIMAKVNREPRHASWPASNFFWSSAIKNTALASMALFVKDPDDQTIPAALDFLLNRKRVSRDGGTQDSLCVAWIVTEFALARGEGAANFKATVSSGAKPLAEGVFDSSNILAEILGEVPMEELSELDMPADIRVAKRGEGTLYYDMVLSYYLPPDKTPTREEGIIISREYYALNDVREEKPLSEFEAGENYRGHITIFAPQELNYVVVEEKLPAGFEPIDMTLATSSRAAFAAAVEMPDDPERFGYRESSETNYDDVVPHEDYGMSWGFSHQEIRDDAIIWSDEIVPAGVYHIRYPVRATTAGRYLMPGATAFEFYEPEIFGRSRGREIRIR